MTGTLEHLLHGHLLFKYFGRKEECSMLTVLAHMQVLHYGSTLLVQGLEGALSGGGWGCAPTTYRCPRDPGGAPIWYPLARRRPRTRAAHRTGDSSSSSPPWCPVHNDTNIAKEKQNIRTHEQTQVWKRRVKHVLMHYVHSSSLFGWLYQVLRFSTKLCQNSASSCANGQWCM